MLFEILWLKEGSSLSCRAAAGFSLKLRPVDNLNQITDLFISSLWKSSGSKCGDWLDGQWHPRDWLFGCTNTVWVKCRGGVGGICLNYLNTTFPCKCPCTWIFRCNTFSFSTQGLPFPFDLCLCCVPLKEKKKKGKRCLYVGIKGDSRWFAIKNTRENWLLSPGSPKPTEVKRSPEGSYDLGISSWWCSPRQEHHQFYCTEVYRMMQYFTLQLASQWVQKESFLHNIQPVTLPNSIIQNSISTNLLLAMPFRQAAISVFPNFSPFSLQQDIMQYFQIH